MNILLINTSEKNGGAAVAANRLLSALNNQGQQASMLVGNRQTDNPNVSLLPHPWRNKACFMLEKIKLFAANGFTREGLFSVDTACCGTDITHLPQFRQADVIHLHWVNQGFLSLPALQKIIHSGKPIVWTMHDMWPFTGICHYAAQCTHYEKQCGMCHRLKYPRPNDLSHQVWKKKNANMQNQRMHFVAVSSWLRQCAMQSALLKSQEISVIPNVLPLNNYTIHPKSQARALLCVPQNAKVILFGAVRIDDPLKGFSNLTKALQTILTSNSSSNQELHLLLFGRIKNPDILKSIPIPFTWVGSVQGDERLSQIYSAADVSVVASAYETFGQVVVEAQACGCTPVTFAGSGQQDIIHHLHNGYLAKWLDCNDLAQGILWALQNPCDPQMLRQSVLQRYSPTTVASQYLDLYNRICKQGK